MPVCVSVPVPVPVSVSVCGFVFVCVCVLVCVHWIWALFGADHAPVRWRAPGTVCLSHLLSEGKSAETVAQAPLQTRPL